MKKNDKCLIMWLKKKRERDSRDLRVEWGKFSLQINFCRQFYWDWRLNVHLIVSVPEFTYLLVHLIVSVPEFTYLLYLLRLVIKLHLGYEGSCLWLEKVLHGLKTVAVIVQSKYLKIQKPKVQSNYIFAFTSFTLFWQLLTNKHTHTHTHTNRRWMKAVQ